MSTSSSPAKFTKYSVTNNSSIWVLVIGNYKSGDTISNHLAPGDRAILEATERFSHYRPCSSDYTGPDRSWYNGPTSLQTEHHDLENITVYEKDRNHIFVGNIIASWNDLKSHNNFRITDFLFFMSNPYLKDFL
jgi:hypothetical protein